MEIGQTNTTKKAILDALSKEALQDDSIGKPESPVLPLVGSENVPVTPKEEELYRE